MMKSPPTNEGATLDELAQLANQLHAEIVERARTTLCRAYECGKTLVKCKKLGTVS